MARMTTEGMGVAEGSVAESSAAGSAARLRAAILAAADAIEAAREPLCALDATTGDGDHGMTMTIGARGIRRQLERVESDDDAVALVRAAAAGMGSAGGAIGPIYGRALLAVADAIASEPGAGAVVVALHAAEAAAAAVTALGGAQPGDKTILDALVPYTEALASAESRGLGLSDAAAEAAAAARAGADTTASMQARIGRSSRFGERSIGTADPGATSFAIIVEAIAGSING
jgi:dihydroxyacetone kinase phosphoprotein-dependent L subunit